MAHKISPEQVMNYLADKQIPQFFEAMMTAIMIEQPNDFLRFIVDYVNKEIEKTSKQANFYEDSRSKKPSSASTKLNDRRSSANSLSNKDKSKIIPDMLHEDSDTVKTLKQSIDSSHLTIESSCGPSNLYTNHASQILSEIINKDSDRPNSSAKHSSRHSSARSMNVLNSNENTNIEQAPYKRSQQNSRQSSAKGAQKSNAYNSKFTAIFIGGPGSGKGTQCKRLAEEYGLMHLSSGELLREEVNSGSLLGQELAIIMRNGEFVSSEIVIGLLKNAIEANLNNYNGFLIDGFPRERDQAELLEKEFKYDLVVYCSVSVNIMLERLRKRGETSGRPDDNEETFQKRVEKFNKTNEPLIEYYRNRNMLEEVNAESDPGTVYTDIKAIFDKYLKNLKN